LQPNSVKSDRLLEEAYIAESGTYNRLGPIFVGMFIGLDGVSDGDGGWSSGLGAPPDEVTEEELDQIHDSEGRIVGDDDSDLLDEEDLLERELERNLLFGERPILENPEDQETFEQAVAHGLIWLETQGRSTVKR